MHIRHMNDTIPLKLSEKYVRFYRGKEKHNYCHDLGRHEILRNLMRALNIEHMKIMTREIIYNFWSKNLLIWQLQYFIALTHGDGGYHLYKYHWTPTNLL